MSLRVRRRWKILPGVHINLGKKGISVSAGVRGASVTHGASGTTTSVGLPGTGISARKTVRASSDSASGAGSWVLLLLVGLAAFALASIFF